MSRHHRILIVTNGPLCRNPRPLKEADALGRAGFDVTVLTVRTRADSEEADREILRGAPYRRAAVDLIPGHGTGAFRLLARRGSQWAARQLSRLLAIQSARALGPAGAILARARGLPADLTIVHNEVPHWVGTRLIREGRRVAADIEDWHSEDLLPEDRAGRPLSLIRSVEQTLLCDASYTTTTSVALADALHQRYGGRGPVVITNSFPLQSDPHRGPAGNPPSLFWFSQTLGPGRGLELFIAAWSLTRLPSRLVLLGESAGSFRESLLRRLPASRRDRVSFLPLVSPAHLPSVIAGHDVGLALEQDFIVNRGLTVTNKILQYLNAGLAVVASDTAGQREVLARNPDAGILVKLTETTALARNIDELLGDQAGLARRQAAARALAEAHYCWEKQAPILLKLVGEALKQ